MEKIIDAALGLIEALVIGSAIGFGGVKAIEVMCSISSKCTIKFHTFVPAERKRGVRHIKRYFKG